VLRLVAGLSQSTRQPRRELGINRETNQFYATLKMASSISEEANSRQARISSASR
jgi:hypothetical protein